jgi:hypothetical protein
MIMVDVEVNNTLGESYEKPRDFGNIDGALSLIGSEKHGNLTHVPEFIGEIRDYKDV